jgi:hypothetical protein
LSRAVVLEFSCKDDIGATRLLIDAWRKHVDPDHSIPDEDIRIDVFRLRPPGSGIAIWRRTRSLRAMPGA